MKPDYLKNFTDMFPENMKLDVSNVFSIISLENKHSYDLISSNSYEINLNGEMLRIPIRVYFNEPKQQNENQLSEKQKDILNCIFSRHHNGYVREKRLKQLSETPKKWKAPFFIQLLGEYIYELLPILDKKMSKNSLELYSEFITENPKFWAQTESKMISYWNEYYRYKFPILKEYLGYNIMNRINNECTIRNKNNRIK